MAFVFRDAAKLSLVAAEETSPCFTSRKTIFDTASMRDHCRPHRVRTVRARQVVQYRVLAVDPLSMSKIAANPGDRDG
jgi:hypothetical protein